MEYLCALARAARGADTSETVSLQVVEHLAGSFLQRFQVFVQAASRGFACEVAGAGPEAHTRASSGENRPA